MSQSQYRLTRRGEIVRDITLGAICLLSSLAAVVLYAIVMLAWFGLL